MTNSDDHRRQNPLKKVERGRYGRLTDWLWGRAEACSRRANHHNRVLRDLEILPITKENEIYLVFLVDPFGARGVLRFGSSELENPTQKFTPENRSIRVEQTLLFDHVAVEAE